MRQIKKPLPTLKPFAMMKTLKVLIVPLWLITFAAVACMKRSIEEPQPKMHYTFLHNTEIKAADYHHIDIDGNGSTDFAFYTRVVGNPILQRDRLQFLVDSKIETKLLNNEQGESIKMNKTDRLGVKHHGFDWFGVSSIVLAEKLVPLNEAPYWEGMWKEASHHFLPVQVIKEGKAYYGWIEISFDMSAEKLVLHKAAISTESEKEIKAGL